MDRIAIDRVQLHFFTIQEGRLGRDRTRSDDVAVGENQDTLCIHHKAGGLSGHVTLGVERA